MYYLHSACLACFRILLVLGLLLLAVTLPAWAQAPLFLVNDNTTVSEVSFKFVGDQTFEEAQLQTQIATTAPGFLDGVGRIFPFSLFLTPGVYPFDPIALAKDEKRLRIFYQENGFLHPTIGYLASQLDTTDNQIHVIFNIEEGPPLIIQDVQFLDPDGGFAVSQFEGNLRERWIRFRDRNTFQTGERFSDFELTALQGQVTEWLQNTGYAFPRVQADTTIDGQANTIDITLVVDTGPLGYVSEIEVQGNESVSKSVVEREVPLKVGDRFSSARLNKGQRELFSLNLFRVALAEVPQPQPRDSTVSVRYRVREARLRYVTAQTGYGTLDGVSVQGAWTHRNFLGGARNFTVSAVANTGYLGIVDENSFTPRRFRGSVALRQPYLFSTNLSAIIEPFVEFQRTTFLEQTEKTLGINRSEFGVNTTLIYEFYPFRVISFQHSLSRPKLFSALVADPDDPDAEGFAGSNFTQNVFTLNATLGDADDFLRPERGFLVRPFTELGVFLDVEYFKLGGSATLYQPLTRSINIAGRLTAGRLWPYGNSSDQTNQNTENIFDPIRFYAGGTTDVRGWQENFAGPKFARRDFVGNVDDIPQYTYVYEPIGGTIKYGANLEFRLPFPGLGSDWGTAIFLDAGYIESERRAPAFPDVPPPDPPVPAQDRIALRLGTGAGLRYNTPIGYIRLDLAYKLNPDYRDLRRAEDVYLYQSGQTDTPPEAKSIQRFRVHFGIGQSF